MTNLPKKCHHPDPGPQNLANEYKKQYNILIKNDEQIEGVRQSGHLAAKILDATCAHAAAGVTTQELNDFAHQLHLDAGAIPAPLHYGEPPFPASICTSLNEVICHGIPDKTPLREGDICNIDVTCILDGYYGDCSRMVTIGDASAERALVVDTAYHSLMKAIDILKPGILVSDIGDVIEPYTKARGCSVVNQFVGHGVGIGFHEEPQIPHCRNDKAIPLVAGMIFTIEPMINAGVRQAVIDPDNHWTARTQDRRASGQWEHTLLITNTGYEILTPWTNFFNKETEED